MREFRGRMKLAIEVVVVLAVVSFVLDLQIPACPLQEFVIYFGLWFIGAG